MVIRVQINAAAEGRRAFSQSTLSVPTSGIGQILWLRFIVSMIRMTRSCGCRPLSASLCASFRASFGEAETETRWSCSTNPVGAPA